LKEIYIIDDDESILKLINMTLLKNIKDVFIMTEKNGRRGFRLIKSGHADLIILDINLPGMNGVNICRELRKIQKYKKTPILAFTALDMNGGQEYILNAGFDFCIPKTAELSYIVKIIKKYLK